MGGQHLFEQLVRLIAYSKAQSERAEHCGVQATSRFCSWPEAPVSYSISIRSPFNKILVSEMVLDLSVSGIFWCESRKIAHGTSCRVGERLKCCSRGSTALLLSTSRIAEHLPPRSCHSYMHRKIFTTCLRSVGPSPSLWHPEEAPSRSSSSA